MTYDKVSFYIRDDFSGKGEYIEQRNIVRGDVYGLRNYILQFMETASILDILNMSILKKTL